jgi:hypothetical protein
MPDTKDTNLKTPENRPEPEAPKKPVQAIDDQEKAKAHAAVVPNPQDQEHKEPEKKRA